jgi:hypothetical protein
MSRTDLEARLVHWLHDGPVAAPRDVVEAALAEARLEGQERVISPPWARLPRLGQIDLGPLVRPAATLVAAAVAIVAVVWLFSYAGLPPAATPSPSASPTISPSPSASLGATPSATAAPAVLPTPVARYVGQATDTRAEGTFTIFQLALDNRASFADEFFADAPEYPCADAVGRRTLVDIRDGDTGGYLRRYCGGYDLQSLTFERAVGQSVVTTVYIELVDQLTGLIERSPSIVIPPPTTPTPGPTLSRSAGPPGWSAPE